jgi:LacI family transcriptional regulator
VRTGSCRNGPVLGECTDGQPRRWVRLQVSGRRPAGSIGQPEVGTATIQDVARRAGVGVGSVSRVLNESPLVSDATRAKVQSAIDELDYRPSAVARALSRRRGTAVIVLAPFFSHPSMVLRLRGIAEVLRQSDFDLMLFDFESPDQRDHRIEVASRPGRAAGVIISTPLPIGERAVAGLVEAHLPVVSIDCRVPGSARVWVDNEAGGHMAANHLIRLGHRRIAFVGDVPGGARAFAGSLERLRGYERALAEAGIPIRPEYVRLASIGRGEAHRVAAELFGLPEPPTAVFASSDLRALGILEAARHAGLAVPGGLSVMGFHDIEVASYVGLTTVCHPLYESGVRGAELMLGALSGEDFAGTSVELPLSLAVRETTASPADAG